MTYLPYDLGILNEGNPAAGFGPYHIIEGGASFFIVPDMTSVVYPALQ